MLFHPILTIIIVVSTYLRGKYKPKQILTSSWWLVFVLLVRNSLRKSLNLPASVAGITLKLSNSEWTKEEGSLKNTFFNQFLPEEILFCGVPIII